MRWFCVSLLLAVLGLAAVASTSWPTAAQDKNEFAAQMLAAHNELRQKFNAQPLIWDDGLAALAQEWASKIAASSAMPPPHRPNNAIGENLFWGTADQWLPKDVLEVWENESKNYDRATNTCAPGKFCVHFTQVIWYTTTRVGCGKAKSADGQTDFFVCDYSPPGNLVGQSPFPSNPPTATTTPMVTPTPVAQVITPTPASTPNANTKCEECRKNVQRLTAQVEQLRKQINESAKPTAPTPTPTPTPVARLIPPTPRPTPEFEIIKPTPTPTVPVPCYREVFWGKTRLLDSDKYGIEFMQIPAGRFYMDSTLTRTQRNWGPEHEVTIRSFCMGKYEVTEAQWQAASRPSVAQVKQLTNFELGLLAEHNNVRQRNNVKPLVWDDTLAATAQEWAKKIAADGVQPPAHREGSPYGENITSGRVGTLDPKGVLARWEAEGKNYDRTRNTCTPDNACINFTQVVWSTTTRVGCGKARSADGQTDFLVCNYNPPGNQVGQSPFPTSLAPTQTATLTPTGTPPPATAPTPVTRRITSAATPTPASTPNTNAECNPETNAECEKEVQQLIAEVEQLRKQIRESAVAQVTTPTPASTPDTKAECEELRKSVPQLTAEIEQLKKQRPEYANLATPTPTPPPLDPNQKCPTNKGGIHGIEFLPIPGKSFCMGKYEVTQAQWESVMSDDPSEFQGSRLPVESVSWNDAQNFISKLNESNDGFKYRLPTETEWEYACRAGTTETYYGKVREIGWHKQNSGRETHNVGEKKPNAFGLYDMSGNVWEWCQDRFNERERVLRGGSWHSRRERLASSFRSGISPDDTQPYVGFRVLAERPATIAEASTPTPTPRPVARQIVLGATPTPAATPAATSGTNAECEELRKTVRQLTAQVELLRKPTPPPDPSAKCPANKYGIEFLPIPYVQPFCLGKYEVTQTQWQALMGDNPSSFKDCGGNCPVEMVSWDDAQNFINKLNASNDGFKYRLPTETEWEYACRAGTTGLYYGNVYDIGWHKRNSDDQTHAVGGKLPNAFGLYDMSGNVSEWCQDWYDQSRESRARRGGSWHSLTTDLRSGTRSGMVSREKRNYVGFRVAAVRAP